MWWLGTAANFAIIVAWSSWYRYLAVGSWTSHNLRTLPGRCDLCQLLQVLVIGGGPCGLRVAIEIALLGGKVVVVEKHEGFSCNNVLHLWPFLIHDLKALGAKTFCGKFCAGAIDHISGFKLKFVFCVSSIYSFIVRRFLSSYDYILSLL